MFWKRKKIIKREWEWANFDEVAQFLFKVIEEHERAPKRSFEQIKKDLEFITGNNIKLVSEGLTHCYLSNNYDGEEFLERWVKHAKYNFECRKKFQIKINCKINKKIK